jgi:hypothetical protein
MLLHWTSDQPVEKASTYTEQQNTTEKYEENIHALRGIRTHDLSVKAAKTSYASDRKVTGSSFVLTHLYMLVHICS